MAKKYVGMQNNDVSFVTASQDYDTRNCCLTCHLENIVQDNVQTDMSGITMETAEVTKRFFTAVSLPARSGCYQIS